MSQGRNNVVFQTKINNSGNDNDKRLSSYVELLVKADDEKGVAISQGHLRYVKHNTFGRLHQIK